MERRKEKEKLAKKVLRTMCYWFNEKRRSVDCISSVSDSFLLPLLLVFACFAAINQNWNNMSNFIKFSSKSWLTSNTTRIISTCRFYCNLICIKHHRAACKLNNVDLWTLIGSRRMSDGTRGIIIGRMFRKDRAN